LAAKSLVGQQLSVANVRFVLVDLEQIRWPPDSHCGQKQAGKTNQQRYQLKRCKLYQRSCVVDRSFHVRVSEQRLSVQRDVVDATVIWPNEHFDTMRPAIGKDINRQDARYF
jgi:hypothetical protein